MRTGEAAPDWVPWGTFAASAPEVARFGAQRMRSAVAYLGTVRGNALPRVHPVQPIISAERLMLFMFPASPKAADLQKDGRYALHAGVADTEGTGGEFLVRGRARLVDDPAIRDEAAATGYQPRPEYVLFEFSIERAMANEYVDGQPRPRFWRASA